ncbi:MAG: Calx-beta domain-containing protein, partial [Puniceicoccales bacterium]
MPTVFETWHEQADREYSLIGPQGFTLEDITLDGLDDVVLWWPEGYVTYKEQLAPGVFGESIPLLINELGTLRPVFADLDGDGLKDGVAVTGARGTIWWAKNQGGGVMGPVIDIDIHTNDFRWTRAYADDVAAGDLDQDGDIDLVCVFTYPSSIKIYWNDGNASFEEEVLPQSETHEMDPIRGLNVVDLTGDGWPEIHVEGLKGTQSSMSFRHWFYRNLTGGEFALQRYVTNSRLYSLGVTAAPGYLGDVDGDGLIEIVTNEWKTEDGLPGLIRYDWNGGSFFRTHYEPSVEFREIHQIPDRAGNRLPQFLGGPYIPWNATNTKPEYYGLNFSNRDYDFIDLAAHLPFEPGRNYVFRDFNLDGRVDLLQFLYGRLNPGEVELLLLTNREPRLFLPDSRMVFEEGLPAGIPGNTAFLKVRKEAPGIPLYVRYSMRAGTATDGEDMVLREGTISIPAWEPEGLIPLTIREDGALEPDETFFVDIETPDGWEAFNTTTEVTIVDSTVSRVTIEESVETNEEEGGATPVIISKSNLSSDVEVDFQLISDSALQGSDFVAASGTIRLPAGTTSHQLDVAVIADGLDEPDGEQFRVVLSNPQNAEIINDTSVITIQDSDYLTVSTSVPFQFSEDNANIPVRFRLSHPSVNTVYVNFRLDSDTLTVAPDGDIELVSGELQEVVFTPGQTEAVFNLPIGQDDLAEETEGCFLQIVSASNAQVSGRSVWRVEILDDDTPQLTLSSTPVSESEGLAFVVLELSNPSDREVRVSVDLADYEAQAGEDFSRDGFPKVVGIRAGNLTSSFTIAIIDDGRVEPKEAFYATVVDVIGARHDGSNHPVEILASDGSSGQWYEPESDVVNAGQSVAAWRNTIVLGAPTSVNSGMLGMSGGSDDGAVVSLNMATTSESWASGVDFGNGHSHSGFGGAGLATNGRIVAVGETDFNTETLNFIGAVHLFDADSGDYRTTLTPSQMQQATNFGGEVEICGRFLVTSAPNEIDVGSGGMPGLPGIGPSGVIYVFDWETETEIARIAAPDDGHPGVFGQSLALNSQYLVVGSPTDQFGMTSGRVYVYDTVSQAYLYSISPPDGGFGGDRFGGALAIIGNRLFVGAPNYTLIPSSPQQMQTRSGAVFAYTLGAQSATLDYEKFPDEPTYGAEFGYHLALYGSTLLASAPGETVDNTFVQAGAVYGFDADTGETLLRITSPSPQGGAEFGRSFDFYGSELVVGVPGRGMHGGAYRFTLDRPGYDGWFGRLAGACGEVAINVSSAGLHPLVFYALGGDESGEGASEPVASGG